MQARVGRNLTGCTVPRDSILVTLPTPTTLSYSQTVHQQPAVSRKSSSDLAQGHTSSTGRTHAALHDKGNPRKAEGPKAKPRQGPSWDQTAQPLPGPALTLYVSVQRHHPGPLRAAEGRVVDVLGERGGDAGRGGPRGRHRVLGRVFFMAGSAVLKPNLKGKQQTLSEEGIGLSCGRSQRPCESCLRGVFTKRHRIWRSPC